MTDQIDIFGDVGPVSWDGVPLFCPETVAEGLFDVSAFGQLRGQTTLEWSVEDGSEPPTQLLASVFGLGTRYFS